MTHNAEQLHRQATERFFGAENSRKLVLIHTAVALGSWLLVAVMNYLFSLGIDETGGLSGLGMRTVLTTAQTFLELVLLVALPFWEVGLLFAALQWARGEQATVGSLLQGFRRLGGVLVYRILYTGVFLLLGMGVFYIAATVFAMTPLAAGLVEQLKPLMDPSATAEQIEAFFTPEQMSAMTGELIPLLVIFGILYVPLAVVVFYRLRFGEYFVIQGERAGNALTDSFYITRKKSWHLLKLDLHFWWYYGLLLLCLLAGMADAVLTVLGVSLPIPRVAAYFVALAVGTLLQGLLYWRCRGSVLCSYCLAFQDLMGERIPQSGEQDTIVQQ